MRRIISQHRFTRSRRFQGSKVHVVEHGNGENRLPSHDKAGGSTTHKWINIVTERVTVANTFTRLRFEKEENTHIHTNQGQHMTLDLTKLFSAIYAIRIEVWYASTLNQSGKCQQLAKEEIIGYNIEILGLNELDEIHQG